MKLLLDTQVGLWAVQSSNALSAAARKAIKHAEEIRFSVVSPWELVIKAALGKITLHLPVPQLCRELEREFGAGTLPVTPGPVPHRRPTRVGRGRGAGVSRAVAQSSGPRSA